MNAPAFHAFDAQHLITLGIIAGVCVLLAWKVRAGRLRRVVGICIGLVLVSYVLFFYIQQAVRNALAWNYALPLDLCNLVLVACILSLFRPTRFLSEIAYFWGMGGVLQATMTPDLSRGFPSWDFILFFWAHGATLAAIIFLASARDFRPSRGSVSRMMIAVNVYAVVVGAINAMTGWNYGYLCRKPAEPSLLDFLGPWPWYLLSLEAVAVITFLLLQLPWRISDAIRRRGALAPVDANR